MGLVLLVETDDASQPVFAGILDLEGDTGTYVDGPDVIVHSVEGASVQIQGDAPTGAARIVDQVHTAHYGVVLLVIADQFHGLAVVRGVHGIDEIVPLADLDDLLIGTCVRVLHI